jgi:hypothetical protein
MDGLGASAPHMPALPVDAEFGDGGWDQQAAAAMAVVAAAEAQAFAEASTPDLKLALPEDEQAPSDAPSARLRHVWRRWRPQLWSAAQVAFAVAAGASAVIWGLGGSWSGLGGAADLARCEEIRVHQRVDPTGATTVVVTGRVRNLSSTPAKIQVDTEVMRGESMTVVPATVGDSQMAAGAAVLAPGDAAPFVAVLDGASVDEAKPVARVVPAS